MDGSSLCLVRADPAVSAEAAGTGSDAAVSRVKTPDADGPVRQLAAGLLSTGKKRRLSRGSSRGDQCPVWPSYALIYVSVMIYLCLFFVKRMRARGGEINLGSTTPEI